MTEGERGLGLNNKLCAEVWAVESFEELLDVARTINEDFCIPPVSDIEVIRRARQVWDDAQAGKLARYHRRETGKGDGELLYLCSMSRHGAEAYALLVKLRAEHSARCRRGEKFAISARAMAKAQTVPNWTEHMYRRGRDLLLKAGFIELVQAFKFNRYSAQPARYKLTLPPGLMRNTPVGERGGGGSIVALGANPARIETSI